MERQYNTLRLNIDYSCSSQMIVNPGVPLLRLRHLMITTILITRITVIIQELTLTISYGDKSTKVTISSQKWDYFNTERVCRN